MRGSYSEFQAADTIAVGISDGTAASHARFRKSLGLPYELLVDADLAVSAAYDALKPDPANPDRTLPRIQRTVYVIGKDGSVIYRQRGNPPMEEILAAIDAAG